MRWFKDGKELNKFDYNANHADGVVTIEIVNCTVEDSGRYICRASNPLGEDETWCEVIVEGITIIHFLRYIIIYLIKHFVIFMHLFKFYDCS